MAKRRPNSPPPPPPPTSYASARQSLRDRERLWPSLGWKRHLVVLATLLLLIAGFFSNSFSTGMTLDNRYIIDEYYRTLTHQQPQLDLVSSQQMGLIFKNDYWYPKGISGLYRPLTVLSYWLDFAVINNRATQTRCSVSAN